MAEGGDDVPGGVKEGEQEDQERGDGREDAGDQGRQRSAKKVGKPADAILLMSTTSRNYVLHYSTHISLVLTSFWCLG